ncbi:MAG: hypothetical protein KC560_20990 [Myxococcales bacterium]|nr:hypothetical protein [Myxococcales bacterium]
MNHRVRRLLAFLELDPESAQFLKRFKNLDFAPEAKNCLLNCMIQRHRHAGALVHGWVIWDNEPANSCEAEAHVVWAKSSILHDLTPRIDGEEKVLFVPDMRHVATFDETANPPRTHTYDNARLRDGVYTPPKKITLPFLIESDLPALLSK